MNEPKIETTQIDESQWPNIYKLLYIGDRKPQEWDDISRPIHIRISIGADKLNPGKPGPVFSGMGVIGAKRNGDCADSSCQCEDAIRQYAINNQIKYAEGWNKEKLIEVLACWKKWHLNGMRAGCEHQRESWNRLEVLEVKEWTLTTEAWKLRREIEARVLETVKRGETAKLDESEQALLNSPLSVKWPDSPGDTYKINSVENKPACWVYPAEHPKGLLTKPCEVCGYSYGSSSLFEPIPQEVIDYVQKLPQATKECAWKNL